MTSANLNFEKIKNRIESHKKVLISYDELKEILGSNEHGDVVSVVNYLLEQEIIAPVKTAKNTPKYPFIKDKYRINREILDTESEQKQIRQSFCIKFKTDYYQKHINEYKQNKANIDKLSNFFKEKEYLLGTPLSKNERSFEIFGDEKLLSSGNMNNILAKLGMSMNDLNVYKTPEPFFYEYNIEIGSKLVLVVENKDTWYTMRAFIKEGKPILGTLFKAVIYGEGNKIISSFRDIVDEDNLTHFNVELDYIYFGDIDYEGVDIYRRLKKAYPSVHLKPFEEAYNYLLSRYGERRNKDIKKTTHVVDTEFVQKEFGFLNESDYANLIGVLLSNEILPQEMLNNRVLRGALNA